MDIIATQKFLRMSPRKVRPVVALIRKMDPLKAVEVLPYIGKRPAEPLLKVIKAAIANATQMGIANTELKFKEIQIGEGPTLKRGTPVSKGRFHPIKKRMSHIRVVLQSTSEVKVSKNEVKVEEAKEVKEVKLNDAKKKLVSKVKEKKNGTKN